MNLSKVFRPAQRSAGASHIRAALTPRSTCSRPGCSSAAGIRCQYVDDSGEGCGDWCSAHASVMDGRVLCERHRNVVRRTHSRVGTIYELKGRPAVNDRRATLVASIVDDLDGDVRRVLRDAFSGHAGAKIATDPAVREGFRVTNGVAACAEDSLLVATRRAMTWTRGWAVYSNQGNLCRLTIEVPEGAETEASLAVDGRVVFTATPDVINAHRHTEPRAVQTFRSGVLEALSTCLYERSGPISW